MEYDDICGKCEGRLEGHEDALQCKWCHTVYYKEKRWTRMTGYTDERVGLPERIFYVVD